eukprot:4830838-Amphidinium_carterae.1
MAERIVTFFCLANNNAVVPSLSMCPSSSASLVLKKRNHFAHVALLGGWQHVDKSSQPEAYSWHFDPNHSKDGAD